MKSSLRYLLLTLVFVMASIGLLWSGFGKHTLINAGYATRFAWDKKPKPFNIKTHFYGKELSEEENCALNGWSLNAGRSLSGLVWSGGGTREREVTTETATLLILRFHNLVGNHAFRLACIRSLSII